MKRYFNVVAILCAAVAAAFLLPAAASAGCPGCEEYTLDIPENDGGGGDPAPAPAPAPTAPAPVTPTTPATTVPEATVPVAPAVAEPEKKKPPKPVDTDPEPVPSDAAVKPVDLAGIPAIAAAQSRPLAPAEDDAGGILPLALAMGAVALVAGFVGVRRREPDGDEAAG